VRRHLPLPDSRSSHLPVGTALTAVLAAAVTLAPSAAAVPSSDLPASSTGPAGSTGSAGSAGSGGSTGSATPGAGIAPTGTFADPYSTEPGNNILAFGDSFTANSASYVNENPDRYPTYPRKEGCLVAPEAWPGLLGTMTGRPVQNWACNAHTTSDMLGRISRATAAGAVNDSSTVVLAAGMNDKRAGATDDTVTANLVAAVDRIRDAAPQARVIILGRLATTDSTGRFCSRNTIPNFPTGGPDPETAAYEVATRRSQQNAASQAGVPFLDIRSLTVKEHSSCAPDAQRYISGLVDRTTPGVNMPGHPSLAGSRFLATQVAAQIAAQVTTQTVAALLAP
jgi:lysophospholipase L1-like esterase